jgi:hypothetical protein
VDEVRLELSRVNSRKATGPDNFPNWILKDFSDILSLPLCSIFNASIEEAYLPTIWKSADVISSPKTTPVKDAASDLRPISLTPVMSKIGESFIYKWLLEAIEDILKNRPKPIWCNKELMYHGRLNVYDPQMVSSS